MPEVSTWLSLLWVLVCVVLIVAMAYWFTKYVVGRGRLGAFGAARGTEQLKVLARLGLGKDQTVLLVQVGERYFLLGATPSAISNLAELTAEEARSWTEKPDQPAPPSFGEALRTVIQQRRQR